MHITAKKLVLLALVCLALSPLSAAVAWQPYLAFGSGDTKIEGKDAPYLELALGTPVGSRINAEAYVSAQPLSGFPYAPFEESDTDSVHALAVQSGFRVSLTLFDDATFNPMMQVSAGHLAVASQESEESAPNINTYFSSSIASGFELNFFDSFQIILLSGYRYNPHEAVVGLDKDALSSRYSSVSFRATLN
ncbi:MAG: hypothetical protein EOM32_10420 [Spirochaetia bacterium]|nr:hypothetical protein [Spirochaetia bacterium]